MAELYPAEQAFTANLTALLSRNAVWKETNETVVGMKTDIEAALKHVSLCVYMRSRASQLLQTQCIIVATRVLRHSSSAIAMHTCQPPSNAAG